MALQGTLETFALPDVLRLLASTHKTGRLRLTGANGSGSLWLDGGAIVSSEAARAPLADGPTDVLFELLRFKEGDFVFDDDATADAHGAPTEVEDALAAAEAMLEEWKSIEAVVPSLAAWVSLRPELPGDDVTVDAAHWRQLVAVGGGITVSGLGDQLGLAELPISRAVKDLIELGLVELGEASEAAFDPAPAPVAAAEVAEPAFVDPGPAITFDAGTPAAETPLLTVVGDADSLGDADSFSSEDRFDPSALIVEDTAVATPSPRWRSSPTRTTWLTRPRSLASWPTSARRRPRPWPPRPRPPPPRSVRPPWPRSTRPRTRSTADSCSSSSARSTADRSTRVGRPRA